MYLWNTEALATKLKDSELSQAERFKYFFIFIVLNALIMELSLYIGEMPTVITITESVIALIMTMSGTLLAYNINKNGDDKEFTDRYICLSIPILIKVIVLSIVTYIIYTSVGYMMSNEAFDNYIDSTTWIDILFTLVFESLFYWRLICHISRISKVKLSDDYEND